MSGIPHTAPVDWPWGHNWLPLEGLPDVHRDLHLQVQCKINELISVMGNEKAIPYLSKITWGMTCTNVLNAEARAMVTGKHAIAIDAGSILQLLDTFRRLLANSSILPDVGEPVDSSPVRQALIRYYPASDPPIVRELRPGSWKPAPMEGKLRYAYIKHLTHRAIQFMYLHEAAHILEGHVDYISFNLVDSVDELKALEHKADILAVYMALLFESLHESSEGYNHPNEGLKFRLWGFAICTWFHLIEAFDHQSVSLVPDQGRRYPLAHVRSFIVNGAPAGGGFLVKDFNWRGVHENVCHGFEEAHRAWDLMGWGAYQYPIMNEVDQALREITAWDNRLKPLSVLPTNERITG